jgi:site-specific DNA recombinase
MPTPGDLSGTPLRAALYTRVSTQRQVEEGYSLDAQDDMGRERIDREGWQLGEVFSDAGLSGKRDDRPDLERFLSRLDEFDVLVVPSLTRLGRSNSHLHEIFDRLDRANVDLVSIKENFDTTTPAGKLLRNVLASLGEFEVDMLSERVSIAAAVRREEGKPNGGPLNFGIEAPAKGERAPIRELEPVVQMIFADAAVGVPQKQISDALAAKGVPTAKGGDWHQGTVGQILKNPIYMELGIITPELWQKVEGVRAAAATTKSKRRGRPPKGKHLFRKSGPQLRCGDCGGAMVSRTDPNRKQAPSETYYCYGKKQGEDCSMPPLRRAEIDEAVYDYFETVRLDIDATVEQMAAAQDRELAEAEGSLALAEKDTLQAQDRLTRVRRAFQDGKITPEDWSDQKPELEAELQAAEESADTRRKRLEAAGDSSRLREAEKELGERLTAVRQAFAGEITGAPDLPSVRAAISRLFKEFVVSVPVHGRATIDPIKHPAHFEDDSLVISPGRVPLEIAGNKNVDGLTR